MASTYQTPIISPTFEGTYRDLRNTPFSVPTYKFVLDTEFHPPNAGPGVFAFHNQWQLISPLKNVKWIKLLWAVIPNGTNSDEMVNLHFNWGAGSNSSSGTWGGAFPPRHGSTTSTQFLDGTSNAFAALVNDTLGAANQSLIFKGEDYHIEQYFPSPIEINRIKLSEVTNSHGTPIGYGTGEEPIKLLFAFEVVCAVKE